MIMRPAGEPRLDLGGLMGGMVIHDDMDIEPFRDSSIDLFEELQELGCPVTLVAFADEPPRRHRVRQTARSYHAARSCACDVRVRQASSVRPAARAAVDAQRSGKL